MGENLMFVSIPEVVIATNTFVCPIVIRYKDLSMLEMVKEVAAYTPKIPIFHRDGTPGSFRCTLRTPNSSASTPPSWSRARA